MRLGHDFLAGGHYPKAILNALPVGGGAAVGVFLNTFPKKGHGICEKLAAQNKVAELVPHAAPFDKSHRYPIRELMPILLREAAWAEALSRRNPNLVVMYSPFCEHNHTRRDMEPLFNQLRGIAPSCLMLNSIWKGEEVPGTITEIHIPNLAQLPRVPRNEYTVSLDGLGGKGEGDAPDIDLVRLFRIYANARHFRMWNFRYNGKYGHLDEAAVNNRQHFPDVRYILGHHALMMPREGLITWGENMLLKPFADDHGSGGKDNKLMCILPTPSIVPTVEVLDMNGRVIDRMTPPKKDAKHKGKPAGIRYYSSRYAYEVGQIARQNTGTSQVRVRAGSLITPPTDVTKRSRPRA